MGPVGWWAGVRAGLAKGVSSAQRCGGCKEGAAEAWGVAGRGPRCAKVLDRSLLRMFRECRGGRHGWGKGAAVTDESI